MEANALSSTGTEVSKGKKLSQNILIQNGDQIYVPGGVKNDATLQQYNNMLRRVLDVEDYIDILRRHTRLGTGSQSSLGLVIFLRRRVLHEEYVRLKGRSPNHSASNLRCSRSNHCEPVDERPGGADGDFHLSRTSLSELIQRPALNLYPRERKDKPLEDVIEQMRTRDVHISVMNIISEYRRDARLPLSRFLSPTKTPQKPRMWFWPS